MSKRADISLAGPRRTSRPWSQPRAAWTRCLDRRATLLSTVVLATLVILSLITLPYATAWYNVQALDEAIRHPPTLRPVVPLSHFVDQNRRQQPRMHEDAAARSPVDDSAARDGAQRAKTRDAGLGTRLAYAATSWFGHDNLGRSLFYRVLPGLLVSLMIGLAAAVVAVVIGATWGAVAALAGGRIDLLMMRIVDVLYGLPYILMVILLKIGLTPPLRTLLGGRTGYADIVVLLVAIGSVSWLTMARVVRGQVLSLRDQGFVEAARAIGARPVYTLRAHILPNMIGPIVTYAMLVVPQAILQESFLSFLGIGVPPPVPSLGRLAADGIEAVNTFVGFWWLIVFPCGALVVTLLALNFIGDALRDAFDPKSTAATLVT